MITLSLLAFFSMQPSKNTHLNNIQTIYVKSAGLDSGNGSAEAPFVLAEGREYDFNRLVRPLLDNGIPVRVIVADGIYNNVRLQLIREGKDTQVLYLTNRKDGKTSYNHAGSTCNKEGRNCRVLAADFTMGADTTTPLELEAEHDGKAIFDGSGTRDAAPNVDSNALTISGSIFGADPSHPFDASSRKISNILVQGLVFRNYRNGVHIQYASHVIISSCSFDNIGNRVPRTTNSQHFGTFGIRVDDASQFILLRKNSISNVWNVGSSKSSSVGEADPGLIHSIYDGYSHDVVFRDNIITNSSGPMIKFGFYPIVSNKVTYTYPSGAADRRHIFINNKFLFTDHTTDFANGSDVQIGQAFVHDNSRIALKSGFPTETAPAAGVIFLANDFVNSSSRSTKMPIALLRQELSSDDDDPDFPGWVFQKNSIIGIDSSWLLIDRVRGTSVSPDSYNHASKEQDASLKLDLPNQIAKREPADQISSNIWFPILKNVIQTVLRSKEPNDDSLLLSIAQSSDVDISM